VENCLQYEWNKMTTLTSLKDVEVSLAEAEVSLGEVEAFPGEAGDSQVAEDHWEDCGDHPLLLCNPQTMANWWETRPLYMMEIGRKPKHS